MRRIFDQWIIVFYLVLIGWVSSYVGTWLFFTVVGWYIFAPIIKEANNNLTKLVGKTNIYDNSRTNTTEHKTSTAAKQWQLHLAVSRNDIIRVRNLVHMGVDPFEKYRFSQEIKGASAKSAYDYAREKGLINISDFFESLKKDRK